MSQSLLVALFLDSLTSYPDQIINQILQCNIHISNLSGCIANKFQIKDLVEKLYGVKVVNVNTAVMRGKNKSRWTKSGLLRGKTSQWKKAFITLADDQVIDFYSNI